MLLICAVPILITLSAFTSPLTSGPVKVSNIPPGLEKTWHFVFIMQENKSFDHYFGTYPGADGIPAGVALKDRRGGTMVTPYHSSANV